MHARQTVTEYFPPKPTFTEADLPSLEGKTYLITGGGAGIGKQLARILYTANATVYIGGRSAAKIGTAISEIKEKPSEFVKVKSSGTGNLIPLIFDLGDLPTIKPAVVQLEQDTVQFNAVFFNAGVMAPPVGSKTSQGYELQWGTNVVGHFLLQKLLIPSLVSSAKQNSETRIIWVSSDGSNMSPTPDGIAWDDINMSKATGSMVTWKAYAQSKAGNIILAAETARRYEAHNIVTASLNPGHLKTELQRHTEGYILDWINATFNYDARFGALTELVAGFSDKISKQDNGRYLIPWGRVGMMADHIKKGLANGSGDRLWKLLEKETAQYA